MTSARLALFVVVAMMLAGCSQPASAESDAGTGTDAGAAAVTVVEDLDFGAPDGIRLDVCLPSGSSAAPRPAIISVHGGGWSRGDKAQPQWRNACTWLASEGFVVFQPNYRLAPSHPFPAAIDDVTAALRWARADPQVARFGHDPARIGAFGDSAGGNLVSLLGTRGDGDTAVGTRVAAVVELSAPLDLTLSGLAIGDMGTAFQRMQLDYLDCAAFDGCVDARAASPMYQVDASDPPFYIAHAVDEFVPIEQAEEFVGLLESAGVDTTFVPISGSEHALGFLDDDLRASIGTWLRETLG
ncbi:alpha/beta hydrolase [Leifsonia sp. YIM 134122]|uniref:Alpha/beta hydrolase n=1 Tax=Leifsonia stereocauli TaxID=3134136 RepID=A0ABU9VZJ5_9MICO